MGAIAAVGVVRNGWLELRGGPFTGSVTGVAGLWTPIMLYSFAIFSAKTITLSRHERITCGPTTILLALIVVGKTRDTTYLITKFKFHLATLDYIE